jgi:predicted HAD superfamily phosphohydrolase YqeG
MALLTPTYCVDSFANLPTCALREEHGILGLGLDLDGSLAGHNDTAISPLHAKKLIEIAGFGIRMGLLSNADDETRVPRVEDFVDGIRQETALEIPAITSYEVGHGKPHKAGFDALCATLEVPPDRMCYFGDQLFKDILGAKLARYGATVLCAPYGQGGDRRVEYLQRPLESLVRPFLGLPRRTADFIKTLPAAPGHEGMPNGYSGGYREAKWACVVGAVGAVAAGGLQIVKGRAKPGVASEALAAGLAGAAVGLRRHEQAEQLLEDLSELAQRSAGGRRP